MQTRMKGIDGSMGETIEGKREGRGNHGREEDEHDNGSRQRQSERRGETKRERQCKD